MNAIASGHAVGLIPVTVAEIDDVTPDTRVLTLTDRGGRHLPGFSGGSHISVVIPNGSDTPLRNAYSLMSSPYDTSKYQIAVRRMDSGRGGSRWLHGIDEGEIVSITPPVNLFPLHKLGRQHILLAGGIGITPIFPQAEELAQAGAAFEVHVTVHDEAHAGLARRLQALYGERVKIRMSDSEGRPDFADILSERPLGSHMYVCGPAGMIQDACAAAQALGWSQSHVHFEHFIEQKSGAAFDVVLARRGITLNIPPEASILEVLEANEIPIPYLCRGGACGQCETPVIGVDGVLEHHDVWLSDEAKACNSHMMPCISRMDGGTLVLDL
jgi:ferredoxin-NADP reductase